MEGDLRASYYQDRARSRMSPAPTKQFADCAQSRSVSPVPLGRGGRKTTLNLRIGCRDFEDLLDDRDEDLISTNASDRRHWQLPSTREELILRYSSQSFRALRTMPVRSYKLDGAELLLSRLSKHYAKFLRQWLKNAQECGVSTDRKRHAAHSSRSTQIIPRQRPMSRGDFDDDSVVSGDRLSPLHTEPTVDLYRPAPRRPPDRPSSVSRLHSIALRRQRRPVERMLSAVAAPVNRRKGEALETVKIAYRKQVAVCAVVGAVAEVVRGRVRDFFTHELFSIPPEHYQWFKCMGKVVRRLVFTLSRVEAETAFLLVVRQLRALAQRRAMRLVEKVAVERLKEEKRKFWAGFLLFRDTKTMEMRLAAMRRTLNRAFFTLATRRKELQQAAFIALWRSMRLAVRPRPKACAHVLWRVVTSHLLYCKSKAFRQWKVTANTAAGKDLLMCARVLIGKFSDFRKKAHFLAWKALCSPLPCKRLSLLAQCLSSVVLSAKLKVWSELTTVPRPLPSAAVLRLTASVLRRLYTSRLGHALRRLQRR